MSGKHVEFAGDWADAIIASLAMLIFAAFCAADLWRILREPFLMRTTTGWETYATGVMGLWLFVLVLRWPEAERSSKLRKLVFLFALFVVVSGVGRLALHWTHASMEIWHVAGAFLNFTNLLVSGSIVVLLGLWLRGKSRVV